jgi:hypothetical protein
MSLIQTTPPPPTGRTPPWGGGAQLGYLSTTANSFVCCLTFVLHDVSNFLEGHALGIKF